MTDGAVNQLKVTDQLTRYRSHSTRVGTPNQPPAVNWPGATASCVCTHCQGRCLGPVHVVNTSPSKTVHCNVTTPLHLCPPSYLWPRKIFSKQLNHPLLQSTIYKSACQPHDCRHAARPCCWWLGLHALGPGPFLASICLHKSLLPEELSTLEALTTPAPAPKVVPSCLRNTPLAPPFSGFGNHTQSYASFLEAPERRR